MSLCTMSGLLWAGFFSLQGPVLVEPQARFSWGDFDRDGLVDLYSIDPLGEDLLLRNVGGGRFEDVTAEFALPRLNHVRSAAFGDYDGDGWPDLFVIPRNGRGVLLRNLRGELFQDVTETAGLLDQGYSESVRWQDFDSDGRVDLVLAGPLGDALFHNVGQTLQRVELPRRPLPGLLDPTAVPVVPELFDLGLPRLAGVFGGGSGGERNLRTGMRGGAVGPMGTPMQSATVLPGSGGAGGSGGPQPPTGGGTTPVVLHREVPRGFSILGPLGAPAPSGYRSTGQTVQVNGDGWIAATGSSPPDPMEGPNGIQESRLLAGYSVAIDPMSGRENLFVFGGSRTSGDTHLVSGLKYDAEAPRGNTPSDQWRAISDMPLPARSDMGVVTVDNIIYAMGGGDSNTTFDLTLTYDPTMGLWATVDAMMLPGALRGAGAGAIARKIYLFGGLNAAGGASRTLLVFDLDAATGGWQTLTGSGITPTPRRGAATAVFDGKLYVIGGLSAAGFLDVVEVFDPEQKRWERKTPCPVAFQSATISVAHGHLIVFGGENFDENGTIQPIGNVSQYDPIDDHWSVRESMITPRSKSVVGRLCKSSYVISGEEEGPGPNQMPVPVPANEEYLENQEEDEKYTRD